MYRSNLTPDYFNLRSSGHFPGMMGIHISNISNGSMSGEMEIKADFFAPNGFLHAGSIVTFADTLAGYATIAHLPENGKSFTTIELKSNFTGAARKGKLLGECMAEHVGRTTQIWRVEVSESESNKRVAIFSCTQLILY
ncbi:MAG: PaaI family thioesterase [Cytophagales bacterium]|nr:PaaI family thioesterase [Cytophagales bacterium]